MKRLGLAAFCLGLALFFFIDSRWLSELFTQKNSTPTALDSPPPTLGETPLGGVASITLEQNRNLKKTATTNQKQIHQTFRLHQRFIEKCFIKHYTKTAGKTTSGKIWVRFQVTKKGKLKSPIIKKSDYTDEDFHICLKDVVSRIQLKNYRGPDMHIEFPIDIQLPQ